MKLLKQLTTAISNHSSITVQSKQPFYSAKFNNILRTNWKLLLEVIFSNNSTKAIALFA